ncbi:MAG TPA: 3-deoxy-8-phosphooctulonate synthase [Candidatus Cloacimonas acidaminovorans]|nr:3-deoxy-8-phosphooctulonate synthase [Candidatus Cloacimonas acidaminovorans]
MNKLYTELASSQNFFLIAGPCVIEEESIMFTVAETLKELCTRKGIPFVFKSSYSKANRSSVNSFSGPGREEGLKILSKIKQEFEVPVLTDVHECVEVASAAEVCDILQIPAFLSRQTELIKTAAVTGRIINIKKGQFMAPEDMKLAAEKASSTGNKQILITERGTTFGYHNLVVDFRSFAIMHQFGYPVVYDVTHSLQRPSVGNYSGGDPEFALPMAKAAIATGMVKGLFIETHPEPQKAKSDSASMLPLAKMESLLESCLQVL